MDYFCSKCGKKEVKQKYLKRINGSWLCKKCYRILIKEKREFLKRTIIGIRTKEQQIEDWKKAREKKEEQKVKLNLGIIRPNIKKPKEKRIKIDLLNKNEKIFFYKNKNKTLIDINTINKQIKKINNKKYRDRFKKKNINKKLIEGLKNL
jgi:HD superfamily phosphohydrolase